MILLSSLEDSASGLDAELKAGAGVGGDALGVSLKETGVLCSGFPRWRLYTRECRFMPERIEKQVGAEGGRGGAWGA
jgi:hypothetical protein